MPGERVSSVGRPRNDVDVDLGDVEVEPDL